MGGRRDVIDPRGIQRCFLSSLLRGHDPAATYDAGSTSPPACLARLLLTDDAFLSVVGTATQEVKLRDRAVFVTALFTLPFYPPQIPTLHSAHAEPAQCACAPDCLVLYVAFFLCYLALSDALSASRCFLKDRMTLHWTDNPTIPPPHPGYTNARMRQVFQHGVIVTARSTSSSCPAPRGYVSHPFPFVPSTLYSRTRESRRYLFSQSPHERAPIHI